jgi:hypothetical protein
MATEALNSATTKLQRTNKIQIHIYIVLGSPPRWYLEEGFILSLDRF